MATGTKPHTPAVPHLIDRDSSLEAAQVKPVSDSPEGAQATAKPSVPDENAEGDDTGEQVAGADQNVEGDDTGEHVGGAGARW
jgi:hypothetical protein